MVCLRLYLIILFFLIFGFNLNSAERQDNKRVCYVLVQKFVEDLEPGTVIEETSEFIKFVGNGGNIHRIQKFSPEVDMEAKKELLKINLGYLARKKEQKQAKLKEEGDAAGILASRLTSVSDEEKSAVEENEMNRLPELGSAIVRVKQELMPAATESRDPSMRESGLAKNLAPVPEPVPEPVGEPKLIAISRAEAAMPEEEEGPGEEEEAEGPGGGGEEESERMAEDSSSSLNSKEIDDLIAKLKRFEFNLSHRENAIRELEKVNDDSGRFEKSKKPFDGQLLYQRGEAHDFRQEIKRIKSQLQSANVDPARYNSSSGIGVSAEEKEENEMERTLGPGSESRAKLVPLSAESRDKSTTREPEPKSTPPELPAHELESIILEQRQQKAHQSWLQPMSVPWQSVALVLVLLGGVAWVCKVAYNNRSHA